MLKKHFILIFLFLYGFVSFAQTHGVLVTYKEVFDTFSPIERLAYLYATPNFSVFEEDYTTTKEIGKSIELDPTVEIIVYQPLVQENKIVTTDLINNKIETFGYLYFENKSKIVDTVKLNWEFLDEKQTIDKIECYKATVNFRGRKWIAWYAPSIPYSSGPLKFHGLPGLIIKLSDEANIYNFNVEKIEFLKEDIFNKKNAEVASISFNQQHTLQEFMLAREQILENGFNCENRARETTMIRQKMLRQGIELKYEWED